MTWLWQAGNAARLERPQYVVDVVLDRPWQGIGLVGKAAGSWNLGADGRAAVCPLQFSATPSVAPGSEQLVEAYIRGDQLFAQYQELPSRDVHPQAVWRDLYSLTRQPAVELRLYMQTRWLESQPRVDLRTTLPSAVELWVLEHRQWRPLPSSGFPRLSLDGSACDGGFLVRPAGAAWSYGELVFATDFRGAEVAWDNHQVVLNYPIFLEPLEKGVVRVARIWSLWLEREGDAERLSALNDELQSGELPLTA